MTPARKIEIYKSAIEVVKQQNYQYSSMGVCGVLYDLSGDSYYQSLNDFPEWYQQKPKGKWIMHAWWSFNEKGRQARIRALERAISLVEKTI